MTTESLYIEGCNAW